MKAIINAGICTMHAVPCHESTVEDEVFYGTVVDILETVAEGWYRIRTPYRYEGIVAEEDLILDPALVSSWESSPKLVVRNKNNCDVLAEPKVQGWHMKHLTRGGVVSPLGEANGSFRKVRLADGREGYMQASILDTYYEEPMSSDEQTMRQALVDTAQLYVGTQYRWGGKSPLGIDCSGLCSAAYLLCGVKIYRDAKIVEGFPIHEIPMENMKPGDLLFFPGHVAMYLGQGRYIHSTGKVGDDGVVYNSLDPSAPDYREDLHKKLSQVGSIF